MDEPDGREVGVILSRGKGRGVAAHVEVLLEASVVRMPRRRSFSP